MLLVSGDKIRPSHRPPALYKAISTTAPTHRNITLAEKAPRGSKKTSNTWEEIRVCSYYLASIEDPWRPKGLRRKMYVLEIFTF
ncbi:hypothetical protein CEXT_220511 [Caerostris extrusa]|uniref:Uncharacterized protein n=1 Tax=Caerostris extrusa TaxID=172846 RepID=A0AAV4NK25_CAEEX|nr:hypothetical protein CEXT_220511 [Caerostris extrusa]